jgi:hypothetical protein
VISLNRPAGRWNVEFFQDSSGNGGGFKVQEIEVDLRP